MINEEKEYSGQRFTHLKIEDLIDLTVTPTEINSKYLHAILHLFAHKLKIGNISIPIATKDAEDVQDKFGEPKLFKILNDNKYEICPLKDRLRCNDFVYRIPRIEQASEYKVTKLPKYKTTPTSQSINSNAIEETPECIERRIKQLEKSLNSIILDFKEYEKCKNVNKMVQINTNEICQLRKEQHLMAQDIEILDDKYRCLEKHIDVIETKILDLKKIRDIVQAIERLMEWRIEVNFELEVAVERYDLLKTIKADKEVIKSLNERKANKRDLLLLTTLELFTCVQNTLYSKISELHERLNRDEQMWMDNFKELEDYMQCKVSRDDLGVIKVSLHRDLHIMGRHVEKLQADFTKRRELHEKYIAKAKVFCKKCTPLRLCPVCRDETDYNMHPNKLAKSSLLKVTKLNPVKSEPVKKSVCK